MFSLSAILHSEKKEKIFLTLDGNFITADNIFKFLRRTIEYEPKLRLNLLVLPGLICKFWIMDIADNLKTVVCRMLTY